MWMKTIQELGGDDLETLSRTTESCFWCEKVKLVFEADPEATEKS